MSDQIEQFREEHGLFRNVPRMVRRAVERRLRQLEADAEEFDRAALEHHGRLKRLHALLHIHPGERARATLFGKPPTDSPRAALRTLVLCKDDPETAAELVQIYRIPYLLAEAALGSLREPVAIALLETMAGEELLARLPLMARRGLLAGMVRDALLGRLQRMASFPHERFPYPKIESVVRNSNLDRQVAAAAFALVGSTTEEAALQGDTALLVDASLSMTREGGCLELAANIGWRVDRALASAAGLWVYLIGNESTAVPLRRGSGLDQWRAALTGPAPEAPGTALGTGVEALLRDGRQAVRLVLVTDGQENRAPRLVSALERYRSATGQRPLVQLVQPANASQQLAGDLRNAQVPFGVFTVDRHLVGLDAFLPAMRTSGAESRVAQILAFR
ncbi:unnamed protein product [uncultured bacterium]|nr:unnamed protein product [uncultured bacterium]